MSKARSATLAGITTEVVAAYTAQNHVQPAEMPALIASIHGAFASLGFAPQLVTEAEKPTPPVSIKKSVTDEYLVSLEDGKRYQSLKRHLTKQGLSPAQYREKWGLPRNCPMVAAAYFAKRSVLTKSRGLANKPEHA